MKLDEFKNVALIVAHPDDETLWSGGLILSNPGWNVFVLSLCRASDHDRAPKFAKALRVLGAKGAMGDLDDSPLQQPLEEEEIQDAIIDLLPVRQYDLVITHHPRGEYTRHLRHEETGKAVIKLWSRGNIASGQLWCFAYEDGGREYYPKAVEKGTFVFPLHKDIWESKYKIIRETYGFEKNSWEAHTTPAMESFWQFVNPHDAMQWLSSLPES